MLYTCVQTGIFPFFAPFAQAFAAVLTAALTGSMYYVNSSRQGTGVLYTFCRFSSIYLQYALFATYFCFI
jgi:hypothetical protein